MNLTETNKIDILKFLSGLKVGGPNGESDIEAIKFRNTAIKIYDADMSAHRKVEFILTLVEGEKKRMEENV